MPLISGEYVHGKNQREPLMRKKERKMYLQWEVYYRRLRKWEAREPSRWRILAHWRWRMEKPKSPEEKA